MNKKEIINLFLDSDVLQQWHWFNYHFSFYHMNLVHPFAESIVNALSNIDNKITDFSKITIKKISSLRGKEKYVPHYEQLMQICSEIYVINQAVKYFKDDDFKFIYEPTCGNSKKNPELIIEAKDFSFGIEVKQPSLINHRKERVTNPIQIATRAIGKMKTFDEKITLPRDNVIKDFLESANSKFRNFKNNPNFYSVLFIIWDDYIYEPISAILGKPCGLFLDESFAKDENGERKAFRYVDTVFIDRQLSQFINSAGDRPLLYNKTEPMDYGALDEFPPKVYIDNSCAKKVPNIIKDCYYVVHCCPELGAEYNPQDFISWF